MPPPAPVESDDSDEDDVVVVDGPGRRCARSILHSVLLSATFDGACGARHLGHSPARGAQLVHAAALLFEVRDEDITFTQDQFNIHLTM